MEPLRQQAKPIQKILYTRKEAAKLLSISTSTLDVYIAKKEITSRRIGGKRLIPHTALVAFSQKNIFETAWQSNGRGKTNQRPGNENQLRLFEAS